ncbi:MAG: TonB-dependent receptor [Kordiimonadales bacterium]|nr:MAG: TonB-dependent receptor [Kordiimonadales bacterium]
MRLPYVSLRGVLSSTSISSMIVGVAAMAAVPASAANNAETETTEDITEITVSATKNPVAAFSVPASVSVVTRAEIEDLLASSIADIFVSVPGLNFDGGPRRNGQTPAIRGVSGEGVVVLFDGVRQSFLSAHDGRFFIEPDLLKSAEVVRGSGSALYGSGAIGGVITFNTVTAADLLPDDSNFGYRLSAGYQGVAGEWAEAITVFGRSEDGRYDGVASISFRNSGDIDLGNGASLQADDKIGSGLLKGTVQVNDALTVSASWLAYRNDAIEPNNGQANNTGDLMDKDVVSDTFRLGVNYNPESNLVDLAIVSYINKANVLEAELDTDRVINRDVETIGLSLDNRSRFKVSDALDITLTYGGEYYRDKQVGSDNNVGDGTRGGVPDATAKTPGIFAQAEIMAHTSIGEFIIIPGIRHDTFRNVSETDGLRTKEGATSPRFAATWQPIEPLIFFGSFAEAFRAPSFNEIFADDLHFTIPLGPGLSAPNFFIPNRDLRPERSKTWEFGAGLDFSDVFTDGDQFTVKGSYFTSDVEDLIDLEVNFAFAAACFNPGAPGTCNSGTSRNINTGRAELDGVEIEGVYNSPRFRTAVSYSTIDGRDKETGDFVGVLTPARLFISSEIKVPEIDSRIGVRVTVAERFDKVNDPANERAAYEKVDLFMVWTPSETLKGLRVDFGIDNLFDTEIETVFAGVLSAGRNVKARVSWTGAF